MYNITIIFSPIMLTSNCDCLIHRAGAVAVVPVTPSLVATATSINTKKSGYRYRNILACLGATLVCATVGGSARGSRRLWQPPTPRQEGGALHPTTWRPSCDLTPSFPAHNNASTASRTFATTLPCANTDHYTSAIMANINWRTINIDALDPDSPANFDLSSLTPAVEPISTADVQNTAQQIRQLLRGGDNEGALQGALESAPYGADDKGKVRCCLLPHNHHNGRHTHN